MKNNTHILYLTHNVNREDSAEAVNLRRRKEVLMDLGFHVTNIFERRSIRETFIELFRFVRQSHIVIIRIDGTCSLDKYSLMKLIAPRTIIIWEIHGYPEESSGQTPLLKQTVARRIFSLFSDAHIFISESLKTYSQKRIAIRSSIIIENFVTSTDVALSNKIKKTSQIIIDKNVWFSIFWGGNQNYPWHAADLLVPVAQAVYKLDPHILFIAIAYNNALPKWNKNVVYLAPMGREAYLSMLNQADICVALYQTPSNIPTYFSPMKMLDYLLMNKPVIISDIPSIHTDFIHNPPGVLTDGSSSQLIKTIINIKNNLSFNKSYVQNTKHLIAHKYGANLALKKYKAFLNKYI